MFSELIFDGEDSLERLDFGFSLIYLWKTFFLKFEMLNSGCGLHVSAGAAYLRVFTVYPIIYETTFCQVSIF